MHMVFNVISVHSGPLPYGCVLRCVLVVEDTGTLAIKTRESQASLHVASGPTERNE